MADDGEIVRLRQEIAQQTEKLNYLKEILREKEHNLKCTETKCSSSKEKNSNRLTNSEISRYSRQLILPEIGVKGQLKLRNTSVLIVGVGGLGCPAAQYLTAAGVGCIGLVDYDVVEVSNLHRQVLHSENKVDIPKTESAKQTLNQLNSTVKCIPHCTQLSSSNALGIISKYDIVLDATDNVATRYLLNDACILAHKPLVSGSALRFEGQLTVYNHEGGPCYRCLFPTPPPPETVGNCSENGVLGAVPGVIGTLQAIEVIKIAVGLESSFSQKMLVYDALDGRFLNVKLRPKQPSCSVCGDNPTILELQDYEQFCGASATDKAKTLKIVKEKDRISVKSYKDVIDSSVPHVLLDVREPVEMDICSLPNSLNIPLRHISMDDKLRPLRESIERVTREETQGSTAVNVYVVCKQGNDSQKAASLLREKFSTLHCNTTGSNHNASEDNSSLHHSQSTDVNARVVFKDIIGGLLAWAKQIDKEFPLY